MSVRRPLVITSDPELLDDLLRLADVAGVSADVAPDPSTGRRWFANAPLVLVGVDAAPACLRAQLVRGQGVVLVGRFAVTEEPDWSVAHALHAEHVAALPVAEPWLANRLAMTTQAPSRGRIVAVLGGRGGAGASVLASGLAVTAASMSLRTMLVDADPLGGGLDLALGWEGLDGPRWPAISTADGRRPAPSTNDGVRGSASSTNDGVRALAPSVTDRLATVFPAKGNLALVSCDRADDSTDVAISAMAATLEAGRDGRDLVVVDLPRCLHDASLVALSCADRCLLVVPTELRAYAAAARVCAVAAAHCSAVSVVVRDVGTSAPAPHEVATALGLALAGTLHSEPSAVRALGCGGPVHGSLRALCRRLLADICPDATQATG